MNSELKCNTVKSIEECRCVFLIKMRKMFYSDLIELDTIFYVFIQNDDYVEQINCYSFRQNNFCGSIKFEFREICVIVCNFSNQNKKR